MQNSILMVRMKNKSKDKQDKVLSGFTSGEYKYGFTTDIETDRVPLGLSEDVIKTISLKKKEPEWLLEFRLKAYHYWLTMKMPNWAIRYSSIDFQASIPFKKYRKLE